MDLSQIQQAIAELPPAEQRALAAWMMDRDRCRWDQEMERDPFVEAAAFRILKNTEW